MVTVVLVRVVGAMTPTEETTEDLLQQARLFVAYLHRLVCGEVGILQPVLYAVVVQIYEVMISFPGSLAQVAAVTQPSFRRHAGEYLSGGPEEVLVFQVHLSCSFPLLTLPFC